MLFYFYEVSHWSFWTVLNTHVYDIWKYSSSVSFLALLKRCCRNGLSTHRHFKMNDTKTYVYRFLFWDWQWSSGYRRTFEAGILPATLLSVLFILNHQIGFTTYWKREGNKQYIVLITQLWLWCPCLCSPLSIKYNYKTILTANLTRTDGRLHLQLIIRLENWRKMASTRRP